MPSSILLKSVDPLHRPECREDDDFAPVSGQPMVMRQGMVIFASTGMLSAATGDSLWALAPHRGLWVPRGVTLTLHFRRGVTPGALTIRDAADLPDSPRLVEMTPLLRELILEAARMAKLPAPSAEVTWINHLLSSRIGAAPEQPSRIRAPTDSRLARICEAIISDPSDNRPIDYWAAKMAMSRRTLTRRFREEIGMSFSMWRQQVRLQEALVRLEMGQPITTIALDVGYECPTSFSTVFRQTFGAPPSRYVAP
ncbi:AraC family transcriptional regulator [Phenylobacterium aquaticum]|uniref:AraC family transcriptional regulator n=1 Tax=Phenylobacterium aquaticum TaxID=1763816 RepID=UPI001F5C6CEA|nr:AraC family transcriptional regulator [Phenylobacterium aquaticum]MCI3131173.1 AraC family transcriptional regulator [Phenylobacterium aquaticum]